MPADEGRTMSFVEFNIGGFVEIGKIFEEEFCVWCPFMDAEVLIAYISQSEFAKITDKAKKQTFRNNQRVDELDATKANELLGVRAVKMWRGFTLNELDFPHTEDNVKKMMNWSAFSRFVVDTCTDLIVMTEIDKKK